MLIYWQKNSSIMSAILLSGGPKSSDFQLHACIIMQNQYQ